MKGRIALLVASFLLLPAVASVADAARPPARRVDRNPKPLVTPLQAAKSKADAIRDQARTDLAGRWCRCHDSSNPRAVGTISVHTTTKYSNNKPLRVYPSLRCEVNGANGVSGKAYSSLCQDFETL